MLSSLSKTAARAHETLGSRGGIGAVLGSRGGIGAVGLQAVVVVGGVGVVGVGSKGGLTVLA